MNSHFQSSATTSTRKGSDLPGIGARGSSSWEPIQITPPSKITVSAGIDHTTNSIRCSYDSSIPRLARVLDDRYHQANAKVATITGTTTTSMIAVELMRTSRCAEAIGPWGSNTPAGLQDATRIAAPTPDQRSRRERRKRLGGRAALLIEIGI